MGIPGLAIASLSANDNLWVALKQGNHIALIRHALAPGFGDPDNFDIDACSTQRNLIGKGREHAREIGKLFRANDMEAANIYLSQWRRCMQTARLIELGLVNELEYLNSFFQHMSREWFQTEAKRRWINAASLHVPTLLVTHQVNILALTGVSPESGGIVFIKREPNGQLSPIGIVKNSQVTKIFT